MPGLTGVEAAPLVRERADPPAVVFVTAHAEYAVEAFAVEAFDYLLKPVDPQRLARVIERLRERARQNAVPVEKIPVVAAGAHRLLLHDQVGNAPGRGGEKLADTDDPSDPATLSPGGARGQVWARRAGPP